MTRSVVISGGRARLKKEGMERNLWNFMRPILPTKFGNVPSETSETCLRVIEITVFLRCGSYIASDV